MKQYKLTAWPDLSPRFRKTTMQRVLSELSQRFASVRDLARNSGASMREVEDLIQALHKDGQLLSRPMPRAVSQPGAWRHWWPVAAVRGLVRARR